MTDPKTIEITLRVSEDSAWWAIHHINDFIAHQPVNTESLAHEFVSALSHAALGAEPA